MTFPSCRRNDLIRKIRLTSKFLKSQPGQQTITIYILPNISQSKGSQTLNFGQVIEYSNSNIFLQKSCRKWGRETSSWPLFLALMTFDSPKLGKQKNKIYKTLEYWFRDMLNFYFVGKDLWIFLYHTLCILFQEKCFSCYTLLTDQMLSPDCLYFLSIGKYVYCKCLLTRLWRHRFQN